MAPKGQKRDAPATKKVLAAKKARAAEATEDLAMVAIVNTIEQSEQMLSQNCRSMLIAGVRGSLNTPSDERHAVQAMVMGMVEQVIDAKQACLQQSWDLAKAAESNIEVTRGELATKLSQAEIVLVEQIKTAEGKTLANVAAQEEVVAATAAHAAKQASRLSGDAAMQEQQASKAAVEHALEKDLKAVIAGEGGCKDLLTLMSKFSFDESLIKALPSTSATAPADRGAFDAMVLNQLETSLKEKMVELSKAVDAEVPGAKQRADAVDSAQAQLYEAMARQATTADEQAAAAASQLDAEAAVEAAKAAVAALVPQESEAVTVRESHAAALEVFLSSTRRPFEALRDATTAKVVVSEARVALEEDHATPTDVEMTPTVVVTEAVLPDHIAEVTLQEPTAVTPAAKDAPTSLAESAFLVTAAGA